MTTLITKDEILDKNEVLKMAIEAGWPDSLVAPIIMAKLHDFAKVVADVASAKEREACAKVCEDKCPGQSLIYVMAMADCAEAIRARGNPHQGGTHECS